jgi:hypothetical protein
LSQHESEAGEKYEQIIDLDEATTQIDVTVVGTIPILVLTDPNDETYIGDTEDGKSVLIIKNPVAGEWTLKAEDEDSSKFKTEIAISWEILVHYGFSIQKPSSLEDTEKNPTNGITLFLQFYNSFNILINKILNSQDPKIFCRSFCQIQ